MPSNVFVWLSAASGLFVWFFMIVLFDDSKILIQSEDRAGQQERLRHVVEQPARHVVDLDHLVSHHHDAAHDEQHRAGVLRDFKAFLVFHGLLYLFTFLHHRAAGSSQQQGDDITDRLKDHLYCLVHTLFNVLNGELLGLFPRPKPPLFHTATVVQGERKVSLLRLFRTAADGRNCNIITIAKLLKIIEKTKHFPDYFLTKTPPRRKETEAADFRFSILIFGEQIKDFNRPPSRSV